MTFSVGQVVVSTDAGGPEMQVDELLGGGRVRVTWWTKGGVRKLAEFPAAGLRDPFEAAATFDVEGFVARLRAAESKPELGRPVAPLMLEGPRCEDKQPEPSPPEAVRLGHRS